MINHIILRPSGDKSALKTSEDPRFPIKLREIIPQKALQEVKSGSKKALNHTISQAKTHIMHAKCTQNRSNHDLSRFFHFRILRATKSKIDS